MLGNFHSILAIIGLVVFVLLFVMTFYLIKYLKKLNEKNDTNKLNHNKTQSEIEAQTQRISTSKKSDTE